MESISCGLGLRIRNSRRGRGCSQLTSALIATLATPLAAASVLLPALIAPTAANASTGWCDPFGASCFTSPLPAASITVTEFFLGSLVGYAPSGSPGALYAIGSSGRALFYYYCPDGSKSFGNTPAGSCPSGPPVAAPCNCGDPVSATPHPIDVLSGNKAFDATDFANANQSLVLHRKFNGAAQTGATSWRAGVAAALLANPVGLGNWLYDFQFELQITNSTPSQPILLVAPDGSTPAFAQNASSPSSLTLVPYTGALYPNPQTDYTLSIANSWPASLTAQQTTWTLQGPDDTIYTLKTFPDPNNGGAFDVARPTAIQWKDGHSWTLNYKATSPYELDTIQDALGNTISLAWIYNAAGTPAAIQAVTLPGGYSIQYTYSTIGGPQAGVSTPDILAQVQYLDNASVVKDSTTYQYSNANCPYNVTGITDSGAVQRWGVTYDNTSCMATVSSVTGVAGAVQSYQVAYAPVVGGGTFTRTVTNPLGTISVYNYSNDTVHNRGLQLVEVDENAGSPPTTGLCPSSIPPSGETFRCYSYGTDGFVSAITDENGNIETQTHVQCSYSGTLNFICGMPKLIVEASNKSTPRTTSITWDTKWHEPDTVLVCASTSCTTSTELSKTSFSHRPFGAVWVKTVTDETNFTIPYPTNGATRKWIWNWAANNLLSSTNGPRWVTGGTIETTTFTHNTAGYVSAVTNPLSQKTTFNTLDWRGAPLQTTDPNGVITNFTYDIHGRLLTANVNATSLGGSAPSEYQFAYDAVGDLSQVTLPMGATIQYQYDPGRRLMKVTNVRGETRTFTYDNADDPLSLVTANASATTTQTHTAMYDEWGRIIQSIGAASQTWKLAYDGLNNLTSVTDPPIGANPGVTRSNVFDGLNRVVTQTDPESHSVGYAYDAADNLNQLTDPRPALVTNRVVDGFGETIQEVSPDRGTLVYTYDGGGNLTKLVDGNGVETDHSYDGADRVAGTTYPSDTTESVTYTWDQIAGGNFGIGRLTGVTDVTGSEAITFDAQGRITGDAKTVKGACTPTPCSNTFTTAYGYDLNGQVTSITYPSGDLVAITRTTDGLVTNMTYTQAGRAVQTLVSNATWAPYGPLASLSYANGLNLTRTYDLDYRLTGLILAPVTGSQVLNLAFGWQSDGRLATVTDNITPTMGPTSRTASYNYTPSGRAMTGNGPWGNVSYAYDASGNLTQNGALTTTVATASNQITSTAGSTVRALNYRPGGELLTDNNSSAAYHYTYGYNAADRVTSVTRAGNASGAYAYDYAGHRVWRQTFGTGTPQTAYVFDIAGHVIAEQNAVTGAVNREYVWLDDKLAGMVIYLNGNAYLRPVTTGQIDDPLVATQEASQSLVWNGYTDPFGLGATFATPGNTLDLRLPGQWYQGEAGKSGLQQNGQRDYDATLGRYVEADPLGINAGANLYGYVDGDPLNTIDPEGEGCAKVGAILFCTSPGGITFALPAPRDFPSRIGPGGLMGWLLYHQYQVKRDLGCVSTIDVQNEFIRFPTPGDSKPATPGGTNNNASVPPLFANNFVTSYSTKDLVSGIPIVVNLTGPYSAFSPGYVLEYARNGAAYTEGEGLSSLQSPKLTDPTLQGILAQLLWGPRMERFIRNARCTCVPGK